MRCNNTIKDTKLNDIFSTEWHAYIQSYALKGDILYIDMNVSLIVRGQVRCPLLPSHRITREDCVSHMRHKTI